MKNCICSYPDFEIWQKADGNIFVINSDGEQHPVKEVLRLDVYEYIRDDALLSACDDYDYSGETDDMEHYCFWKEVTE